MYFPVEFEDIVRRSFEVDVNKTESDLRDLALKHKMFPTERINDLIVKLKPVGPRPTRAKVLGHTPLRLVPTEAE